MVFYFNVIKIFFDKSTLVPFKLMNIGTHVPFKQVFAVNTFEHSKHRFSTLEYHGVRVDVSKATRR